MPACRLPGALRLAAVWCPWAPGTAWGVRSWRAGACRRAFPGAARRLRPVTVRRGRGIPLSVCPGARAAREGGFGGRAGSGNRCPSGETPGSLARSLPPARRTGARPTGRRVIAQGSPRFVVLWGAAAGGAGVRGCWGRRRRPAVSGQWSAGQRDSVAARVHAPDAVSPQPPGGVPAHVPAALLASTIGGYACLPYVQLRRRLTGGGFSGSGGLGLPGGAPRDVTPHPPPCLLSGVRGSPAGHRAIAFRFGRHLHLLLCGGWGCGGGGFLGR